LEKVFKKQNFLIINVLWGQVLIYNIAQAAKIPK
jgi:hypothetical protein